MSTQTSDNNKRIAKNTVLLYARMILLLLVSLYTSRIILQTLGVEDYGVYNVVGGVVAMFTFLNGAMAGATQRFLNFSLGKNNIKEVNEIFNTSVIIHLIIAVSVIGLAETIGLWFMYNKMVIPVNRFDAAFWVFQCSVFSMAVNMMSVPYNAVIIAHEKMGAFAYISLLEAILKLLIVYVLIYAGWDKLKLYACLLLLVSIFIRMIYSSYSKRHFEETKFQWIWNKERMKEMGAFACWNLIGNLALMVVTQGLNMVLNVFFGPIVNAARGVAVQVQNVIQQFATNLQMAINPQITKSYARGDIKYLITLICGSSKFSFFLVYLLSLPILIMTEQILSYWLVTPPEYSASFLRIILLSILIDSLSNSLNTTISASGKIRKYQLVNGLTMISILPISILLLYVCESPIIVFVVQLAITACAHFLKLYFAGKYSHMSFLTYSQKVYVPIMSVVAISAVTPYVLYKYMDHTIVSFIIVGLVSLLSVLISVWLLGLRQNEKKLLLGKVKTMMSKFYLNK